MSEPVRIDIELLKSEIEGKVWGVVLQPGVVDSQGDVVSAEEIEKACHEYMANSRASDVQHSGTPAGADLIENYIAPKDFVMGVRRVLKGSWIQGWAITDSALKHEIATGKRTGLSIEGHADRVPVAV